MPEPLARDEDRRTDVEAEDAVLERARMALAHEEADQPVIRFIHLELAPSERDAGPIDDGEVGGHRVVEAHEPVVEDPDRTLRYHFGHDRHGGHSSDPVCRSPPLEVI